MKFKVERDVKCTVWVKETGEIEAESLKEAEDKSKKNFDKMRSSVILDSIEYITEKENFAMSECDTLIPDDNEYDYSDSKVVSIGLCEAAEPPSE